MDAETTPPKPFFLKRLDSQGATIKDLFLAKYGREYVEAFYHNAMVERGVVWLDRSAEVSAIAFHELTKAKSQ